MKTFARILLLLIAFAFALMIGDIFGQNKLPVALDNRIELGEGGVAMIVATENDYDPDGDILRISAFTFMDKSYTLAAGAGKIIKLWDTGILSVHSNGLIQFWPQKEFNGSKSDGQVEVPPILYTINDNHGGTAKASVIIAYYDSFFVYPDSFPHCVYDDGFGMYYPLLKIKKLGKMHYCYDMGLKHMQYISRDKWVIFYNRNIKCK